MIDMNEKMLQCFNQTRKYGNVDKSNFSLGSPRRELNHDDDFENIMFPRFEAPIDTHLTNLREKD